MDLESMYLDQSNDDQGCVWPTKNPDTGKINRFCGNKTLIDANGNKMAFCSEHKKLAIGLKKAKMGKNYNPSKDLKTSLRIGGVTVTR